MEHLFRAWGAIEHKIHDQNILLFLDYDGTLAPIASRPSLARISQFRRAMIHRVSHLPNVKLAIISGRALPDIKKLVGVRGLAYAGNHGLEVSGPSLRLTHPAALDFRKLGQRLLNRLRQVFRFLPGIFIEEKMFALAVHYRQVRADRVEFAKMILYRELGSYLADSRIVLSEGKKVWEIRPATKWNKGKTVLWMLEVWESYQEKPLFPIYIGDDVTDEDAFECLQKRGLSIKVGDYLKPSSASFFLCDTKQVYDFLRRLIRLKSKGKSEEKSE